MPNLIGMMRMALLVALVTGCGVSNDPAVGLAVTEWCTNDGCSGPDHLPDCDADGVCSCDGVACYEPTCREISCTVYDCTDFGDELCMCTDEVAAGVVDHTVESCLHTTEPRL